MHVRQVCLILVAALALGSFGCAGRVWRATLAEDTAAAYHRYLRENPNSGYADEARARLAFVRVRKKPTVEGFLGFRKDFPTSPLVDELRPHVEKTFFDAARGRGSAAAYRAFLVDFPSGEYTRRAEGNAVYLEARGFPGDLDGLSGFASEHSQSDFAAEAERSGAAVELRGRSRFQKVGLVIDVPADVPSADRLRRLYAERALVAYRRSGVSLIPMDGTTDPRLQQVGARLTISHREGEVSTGFEDGRVLQPGVMAETTVTLVSRGVAEPIWSETFGFRAPVAERGAGESILLHPRAWGQFWERGFFAPVASWNNRHALREPRQLQKPVVAVEVVGSRAVVLFGDGDFQVLDLSDPASPTLLGEYRRERDLAHFDGVAAIPGGVGVFGPDGIEVVSLDGGAHRERVFSRSEVGSVVGLVGLKEGLVAGSNRGLLLLQGDGSVKTLTARPVLGLAREGDRLVFTDGSSFYVATLASLKRGRVEGELRLGRGFRPARVRIAGSSAVVLGDPGVLWVDVSQPGKPRVVSRIGTQEVGEVQDASVLAGRLFLLGSRGLQISDRSGERVVDSVDVTARHRLEAAGRHIVLIGERNLQVLDATAFTTSAAADQAN